MSHVQNDERPYIKVSILGKEILALLDSGSSRTIIGSKGWSLLHDLGMSKLDRSDIDAVTVANGNKCACIGVLKVPIRLNDVEKIIDILVIPDLDHTLILGVDFWLRMGIVPDLRSRAWNFSTEPNLCVVEALRSHDTLTMEQRTVLKNFVDGYFKELKDSLGCTNLVEHKIKLLDNVEPIKQRYYPVSPAMMKHIDRELTEMLDKGVVEPSSSPWSSAIVMVILLLKDDTWRFCVD